VTVSAKETTMRRRWPIIAALGLGLPLLTVFATGCREREVTYYRSYPEREVYVEPGYGYYPHGYHDRYRRHEHFRHEREHAFRHERHERHEREHAVRHEREQREHHG
jgi:hypothetical protein